MPYVGGRLGNQMFKYATLMGIAQYNGYDFGLPYEEIPCSDDKAKNCYDKTELFDCFLKLRCKDSKYNNYPRNFERTGGFDEDFLKIPDNTDIVGFFQTEKYFKHCRNYILDEFLFKDEIYIKAQEFIQEYDINKLVCVHVRNFTDYVQFNMNLPLEYYCRAISHFDDSHTFIIMSDDIQECRLKLKIDNAIYSTNDKYVDMCIMSMIPKTIMSNSTFSWWGSWLKVGNDNITIAPKNWHNENTKQCNLPWMDAPYLPLDIYCDNWILI